MNWQNDIVIIHGTRIISFKNESIGEYNINEFSQKKVEHIFSIFFWNSIRLERQLYQILNQL